MSLAALSRRAILAAGLAAVLLPGAAFALTDEERTVLGEISKKLSALATMNGEFVQFDPNGAQRQGQFFIARPGRVRFQYDPPTTVSVIADGKSVLVFDKKLQTYDIWPLSQTPLRLLLDSSLDLATSDRVTRVSAASDLVEVELQDETRFSAGTLNLVFDRGTNELRQWTVTDQQGLQTMVALYNVETGNNLSSDLFKIDYNAATNAAREKTR
ncbi:MAG: outer membrane lipoprotein carrier protein LolA [Pseudomonadota bacterium]|nr:outer membrane lipoprotein carrier protein LolA [Pseudomonadota bacterium]